MPKPLQTLQPSSKPHPPKTSHPATPQVRAYESITSKAAEYLGFLSKGQLPPRDVGLIHFSDDLVLEGVKYHVSVVRRWVLGLGLEGWGVGRAAQQVGGCAWRGDGGGGLVAGDVQGVLE